MTKDRTSGARRQSAAPKKRRHKRSARREESVVEKKDRSAGKKHEFGRTKDERSIKDSDSAKRDRRDKRKLSRHSLGAKPQSLTDEDDEKSKKKRAAKQAAWERWLGEHDDDDMDADADSGDDGQEEDGAQVDEDEDDGDDEFPDEPVDDDQAHNELSKIPTDADYYAYYRKHLKIRRARTHRVGLSGISTGLPQLDKATGGLHGITVVAGHTQTGKTSLAAQVCVNALGRDPQLAVVYYLLDDMSTDDLFDQMICCEAKVDREAYLDEKLSGDAKRRVRAATGRLRDGVWPRIHTYKVVSGDNRGLTGERIFSFCHHFMEQAGATRLMVVVDMFDDMVLPRAVGDVPAEYVAAVRRIEADPDAWRLQQLIDVRRRSEETCLDGWPILVLAKLRKSLLRHEEPGIEDLLGGVELGYKAKRVYFLVPTPPVETATSEVPIKLVIKKARHAEGINLPLVFHHTQFRFEEQSGRPVTARTKGGHWQADPKTSKCRRERAPRIDPLAGMDK